MSKRKIPTHGAAGRVYELVRRMKEVPDGDRAEQAWRQLLGLPADSPDTALRFALTRVAVTVFEAETAFHAEGCESEFPDPYPPLMRLVSGPVKDVDWRQVKALVSEQGMANLALAAALLAEGEPEDEIHIDTLGEIRGKAESLRSEAVEAEFDPELRGVVIDHLDAILRAIDLYSVSGPEGLRAAFLQSWGVLVTYAREVVASDRTEGTKDEDSIVRKFINFLKDYSVVVRAARDGAVLAGAGMYLLEHLPS
jgi:hypothetical protein